MTDATPEGREDTVPGAGHTPDAASQPGSDLPGPAAEDLVEAGDRLDEATGDGTGNGSGDGTGDGATGGGGDGAGGGAGDALAAATALAEERLADLQRERADFVNYRRRVERDRELAGQEARAAVLQALLPVLDDIEGARQHGDLTGPFAAVADKLAATLARVGLEAFGEPGEPFDPALHEALLHDGSTEVDVPTCTQVLQKGYRTGERVLRPARVAVAQP